MKWVSPTNKYEVRKDPLGDGSYGSMRSKWILGKRIEYPHEGTDFICIPGQEIIAICDDFFIKRVARPYSDDHSFHGIEFTTKWCKGKIFYFNPIQELIGKVCKMGQVIGHAEDLRTKYGQQMIPHIHLQFDGIDPMVV